MTEEDSNIKRKTFKRKFTIEDVYHHSVKKMNANPVLVTFRTAAPTDEKKMTAYIEKEKFKAFKDENNREFTSRLTINETTGKKLFVGSNRQKIDHGNVNGRLVLGVLDRTTGKMKLAEMEEFSVTTKLSSENSAKLSQSFIATSNDSNAKKLFGTKQTQKRQEQIMQDMSLKKVEGMKGIDDATQVVHSQGTDIQKMNEAAVHDYSMLPQPNLKATKVENIYGHLINDEMLESLIDEAISLLSTEVPKDDKISPLFVDCLSAAKLISDENKKLRCACASIYVEYLVLMVSRKRLDTNLIGEAVTKHLKDRYFLTKDGFAHTLGTKNKKYLDMALGDLIIYALTVHDFKMSLSSFLNSVPAKKTKLMEIVRLLRLTVKGDILSLELPLPSLSLVNNRQAKFFSRLLKK